MSLPLFHSRPRHSIRESRLCFQTPPGPERRNLPGVDFINTAWANAGTFVENLFSPNNANEAATRANLNNQRLWISAFGRSDVFTEPQGRREDLRNGRFGPEQLLKTMSPQERIDKFYEFAREALPPNTARRLTPLPAARPTPAPSEDNKNLILGTIAIVLGVRAPDPRRQETAEARAAMREIYPDRDFGHIYEDYRAFVRALRRLPGVAPSLEQLSNREQLLKLAEEHGDLLPGGRYLTFVGWLRVSDNSPANRDRVAAMGNQLRIDDLRDTQVELKTKTQLSNLQLGPRQDAERRNRTFMDNFGMMEPWQQYAVIGLGLFAAYKLWNKPGRFLGIIPYWTIPTGVVGTYLFLRLFRGDHDAINTMTNPIQTGANNIVDSTMRLFNRGILPPTIEQRDARTMQLMARYMNERAFLRDATVAAPMATIAQIRMDRFAGDAFRANLRPGSNRIEFGLYGDDQSLLYRDAQGIIKRNRYDGDTLHRIFADRHCNEQIAQGVASVFYQLAARRPENRTRVERIEKARRSSSQFTPSTASNNSYDNITDPIIVRDYLNMIQEGRKIALSDHADKSLVDLISLFMAEPTAPERPDNAQRVEAPSETGTNRTRGSERALYDNVRNFPLIQDRESSKKLIVAEFTEFLNSCRRPNFRILDDTAAKELTRFANELFENPAIPLPQILLTLEQTKYAVYVGAAARGGGVPLNQSDVFEMIGAAGSADRRNPIARLARIGRYANRQLRILSNLQHIDNLASVQAILDRNFFSGVESNTGGLPDLRKQLREHQERFNRLKSPQAAQVFVNAIVVRDPDVINRFGGGKTGRDRLTTFVERLVASPQYQAFINQGEQYYAQRVTNDILVAQITTHQNNGNHALDNNPNRRFISPIEEQNLLVNNTFLINNILGTDESQPLNGMWAAMNMRQLMADFRPELLDINNEASRVQGVENTRQLAWLFLALNPEALAAADKRRVARIIGGPALGAFPIPDPERDFRDDVRFFARRMVETVTGPITKARAEGDALVKTAEANAKKLKAAAEVEAKAKRAASQKEVLQAARDAVIARERGAKRERANKISEAQNAAAKRLIDERASRAKTAIAARETSLKPYNAAVINAAQLALENNVIRATAARDKAVKAAEQTLKNRQQELDKANATVAEEEKTIDQEIKITVNAIEPLQKQLEFLDPGSNGFVAITKQIAKIQNQSFERVKAGQARLKTAQDQSVKAAAARDKAEFEYNDTVLKGDTAIAEARKDGEQRLSNLRDALANGERLVRQIRDTAAKAGSPQMIQAARDEEAARVKAARDSGEAAVKAAEATADKALAAAQKLRADATTLDEIQEADKEIKQAQDKGKTEIARVRKESEAEVNGLDQLAKKRIATLEQLIPEAEKEAQAFIKLTQDRIDSAITDSESVPPVPGAVDKRQKEIQALLATANAEQKKQLVVDEAALEEMRKKEDAEIEKVANEGSVRMKAEREAGEKVVEEIEKAFKAGTETPDIQKRIQEALRHAADGLVFEAQIRRDEAVEKARDEAQATVDKLEEEIQKLIFIGGEAENSPIIKDRRQQIAKAREQEQTAIKAAEKLVVEAQERQKKFAGEVMGRFDAEIKIATGILQKAAADIAKNTQEALQRQITLLIDAQRAGNAALQNSPSLRETGNGVHLGISDIRSTMLLLGINLSATDQALIKELESLEKSIKDTDSIIKKLQSELDEFTKLNAAPGGPGPGPGGPGPGPGGPGPGGPGPGPGGPGPGGPGPGPGPGPGGPGPGGPGPGPGGPGPGGPGPGGPGPGPGGPGP